MNIEQISNEIWLEIFNYLENIDITNLLRTYSFFRTIKLKKYNLYIKEFSKIDFNSIRYQKATYLLILNIGYYLKKIPPIPSNLTKVFLLNNKNNDTKYYQNFYKYFLSKIKTLISLSINYISDIKKYPKNLTKLNLNYCSGNMKNFPKNLKELKYHQMIFEYDDNIKLPDKLEILDIFCNTTIPISTLVPKLPSNLKSLDFTNLQLPNKLPDTLEEIKLYGMIFYKDLDNNIFKNIRRLTIKSDFEFKVDQEEVIKFQILFDNINKLEELSTNSFWLSKLKIPNSLRKLKLDLNDHHLDSKINLNNITHLYIENRIDPFIDKISSINLIDLTLEGYFMLKKNKFNTPNLSILRLKDFKGNVTKIKSVKLFSFEKEL